MALTGDGWVRRFLVTDPQRHRKGFTVYKVTSIVYPKASPEAITKVVVWKRYNNFKKLHRELQQRHQSLYLKDSFPPFSKSTLFSRFEEEVVEERRISALRLLEFAAEHPPLFTCQTFVKFFESGYSMGHNESNEPTEAVLAGLMDETEIFGLPEPGIRPLRSHQRQPSADSLEPCMSQVGSWPGLESCEGGDDEGHTSDSSDSESSPPQMSLPPEGEEQLLQFFDPLQQNEQKVPGSNEDLVSTNTDLLADLEPKLETVSLEHEVNTGTSCHDAGYIFEAACQVSRAQLHEANACYEAAFAAYKAGIAALLGGVQADSDPARRQVVRDKTAKYLQRAEHIYNTHLAPDPSSNNPSSAMKLQAQGSVLWRPAAEMSHYKVLGVVGRRCMLVCDMSKTNSTSAEPTCFVLKAVYKSPCPLRPEVGPVIPRGVPYMVQLLRYHETENTIFMLLEHISGGRLWDHLGAYVQNSRQSCGPSLADRNSSLNAYLGHNLLEDNRASLADHSDVNMNMQEEGSVTLVQDQNGVGGARFSWSGLDTAELVQNAQRLLQSVTATLHRSEQVIAHSEKPSAVRYIPRSECPVSIPAGPSSSEMKSDQKEQVGERRRSSGTGTGSARSKSSTAGHLVSRARLIERRYSSEDLREGRGSSLEARGRAMRACNAALGIGHHHQPRLPESTVRIWAAQIVLSLEALHACGLVFRDLHPDNILLGPNGGAMLTMAAQWPGVDAHNDTLAVESLYVAPEARGVVAAGPVADWWSMGALLYELLIGKTLVSCHPGGIFSHTLLHLPDWLSPEAKSLLTELLKPDPYERLGSGSHGMENLKSHPFFSSVQWVALYEAGLPASLV